MSQPVTGTSLSIKAVTIIGDYLLLNLLFLLAYLFCYSSFPENITELAGKYLTLLNLCYAFCLSIFKVQLHKRIIQTEKIIGRIFCSITTLIVLFTCTLGLMKTGISAKLLLVFYCVALIGICSWRIFMRHIVKRYRKKGRNSYSAIIVGGKSNVVELYHKLSDDISLGYRIRGIFDDNLLKDFPQEANYLGKVAGTIPYLRKEHVNAVFCCLPSSREAEIMPIINFCENNMIRFYSVPNVRNYLHRKMKLELFDDIPVLYIREEPLQYPGNRLLKRTFDFIVSTLFLCTLYPFIYLIVGAIIKLTSPGPIYFKQERNGENGKIFKCIKFRSMKLNAACDELQATEHDPRKTRFGNFMRKTNIDELPQFINVWKGEMSIVGPRPHMLKHTEEYSRLINKYMIRHLVKPGITGWAQVTGFRGETKELSQMEGRVRKDIWYIENWSFFLDLKIMYKTVANAIHGDKNAY